MINEQLLTYIRSEIARGTDPEVVKSAAIQAGWPAVEVNQGIVIATHDGAPPQPPPPTTSPKPVSEVAPTQTTEVFTAPEETAQPIAAVSVTKKVPLVIAAVVLVLVLGGGLALAYTAGVGPFKVTQYTEGTLFTGLLTKAAEINTASYNVTASLTVNDREAGAKAFVVPEVDPALDEQYANDSRRASDVQTILNGLRSKYGPQQSYDYTKKTWVSKQVASYPTTLTATQIRALGYSSTRGTDPVTGKVYSYTSTEGGKNFALTITFETANAISTIKKSYGYAATTTKIAGKTVVFTKDSSIYFYLPSSTPKPLLGEVADALRLLSSDVSGSVSVGATTDFSKVGSSDWRFNAAAQGDFGDLSYQVDVEAQKKDKDYYIRINKMPALFYFFSSYKGRWIKITPKSGTSTNDSYSELSSISSSLSEAEDTYKEKRAEFVSTLKDLATLADNNKVFAFKSNPVKESVDGRSLYKYQLEPRKEAIIAFYTELLSHPERYKSLGITQDSGLLEYLQSKEFDSTFDYIKNNTFLTLWTDSEGYPAKTEYRMRIVPPDTALQLKDKQIDIVFTSTIQDINKPVQIDVPKDAKTADEIQKEVDANTDPLSSARVKANDASIKSNLSSVRTQAEIYHTKNSSYGTQSRVVGAATPCKGGMFKDSFVSDALVAADKANGEGKSVMCYAYGTGYIAGADLASKGWYCIDSTGANFQESGSLASAGSIKECP